MQELRAESPTLRTSGNARAIIHNDPFDRLILAAARVEGLPVVTSDGKFEDYDAALVDARK